MKKIVMTSMALVLLLVLVTVSGCSQMSGLTQGSSQKSPNIVRGSDLGEDWRMDQMNLSVDADEESLILLRLDYGDKVDGYFYLEKGDGINFEITGNSLIYKTSTDNKDSSGAESDRFSFSASQGQGSTYTLTFSNPAKSGQASVFLEVIYPIGGSLFMPIEKK